MIRLAGLAVMLLLCAGAPPVPAHPRIVSLNPCSDAILVRVADPAQIVALSAYSRNPQSTSLDPALAARFATTHGTVEEVVMLHPDLVIDGAFVAPATADAYRRMGLRLETMGTVRNLADAVADVRRLARLAGHPDRGEALVRAIDTALIAAAPRAGAAPVDAVMWEWGGMVAGDDTLIGDLLRRTGFANMAGRAGFHQADRFPLERMLATPPRLILSVGSDRVLHHPALRAIPGTVRADFPAGLVYCGGPVIIAAVQRLAQIRDALKADH